MPFVETREEHESWREAGRNEGRQLLVYQKKADEGIGLKKHLHGQMDALPSRSSN